jgi:hypothetical protein
MAGFLNEIFRLVGGNKGALPQTAGKGQPCSGALPDAVDLAVERIDGRLRLIPGYSRRLQEPLVGTFRHIDALVEGVPGSLLCCRSAFNEDPRVNAFFVNPGHLQEVFSDSAEVRAVFDREPEIDECWALLCMRREERDHLGMSLVGDSVQRDVMQTSVSFTDHQVVSAGCSEAEARDSLKCCIFNGLLGYARNRLNDARTAGAELENRLKALRGRKRRASDAEGSGEAAARLEAQIDELERQLAQQDLRLTSLEDHLAFVETVFRNPGEYLSGTNCSVRLSRLGIKLKPDAPDSGYEVPLSEISIASRRPRVSVLARFPRAELLPRKDFLIEANLFLAH